ncbi:tumor necrosis factor ligand superfamily member 10-like [Clupea harengus]|uniref:Tumor necrosis factor ligand superfamily member 10 n=1 Tax=Clupea harengus TaxID=7950 RepID=A0A8M1KEB9_CLUHA|nr:tumor necrosis factor ligand superfamily member 10-like [Clupea harengus]
MNACIQEMVRIMNAKLKIAWVFTEQTATAILPTLTVKANHAYCCSSEDFMVLTHCCSSHLKCWFLTTMESSHSLYFGLILLVAVLLQTVAVAVSFLYFNHALSTVKQAFSRSSVSCLMGTNMNIEERKHDPCWQIMQQLQYRMEKTMSHMFKKEFVSAVRGQFEWMSPTTDENHDYGHRPEIAAHLTAKFLTKEERQLERPPTNTKVLGQKIEAWESRRGLAFQNNLEMSNGELIFPQAGLYYIYSQTYFRLFQKESEAREEESRNGQVIQYIYQKMSSYPVPILLMRNARTTCWSRDQDYGLYSIYQAGVIPLGAGDRVFVTVSNISTLDIDERSSFFGAFLVT